MKVLVAREYSGRVRDAFIAAEHQAMSCDLLPTESPGPHYQGDVFDTIEDGWNLMVAHPPYTYLAVSGLHCNKRIPGRAEKTEEALEFVRRLLNTDIEKIALENPISCISSRIRKPDQIIQPWQFGHPESKRTCLWLKNLPPLRHTNVLQKPESGKWDNQTISGNNKLGPSPDRWRKRSLTHLGIAQGYGGPMGVR